MTQRSCQQLGGVLAAENRRSAPRRRARNAHNDRRLSREHELLPAALAKWLRFDCPSQRVDNRLVRPSNPPATAVTSFVTPGATAADPSRAGRRDTDQSHRRKRPNHFGLRRQTPVIRSEPRAPWPATACSGVLHLQPTPLSKTNPGPGCASGSRERPTTRRGDDAGPFDYRIPLKTSMTGSRRPLEDDRQGRRPGADSLDACAQPPHARPIVHDFVDQDDHRPEQHPRQRVLHDPHEPVREVIELPSEPSSSTSADTERKARGPVVTTRVAPASLAPTARSNSRVWPPSIFERFAALVCYDALSTSANNSRAWQLFCTAATCPRRAAPPRCVRASTAQGHPRTNRPAHPSLQALGWDHHGRPRPDTQRGWRHPELVAAVPAVVPPQASFGQPGKASTSEPPFFRDIARRIAAPRLRC